MSDADSLMSEATVDHDTSASDQPSPRHEQPSPSRSPPLLSANDLLFILAHPDNFGLELGVWYAINAPSSMVASHPAHTLAGRLGVSADDLEELAEAAELHVKPKSLSKKLSALRPAAGQRPLSKAREWFGETRVRYATTQTTSTGHTAHSQSHERQPASRTHSSARPSGQRGPIRRAVLQRACATGGSCSAPRKSK